MAPPRPGYGGNVRTTNPYAQAAAGGRTPGWGVGRTPNPYTSTEGRTPAWTASSRTPNPYALDGARTPAWNTSSRTPNPYVDGGRTPAWNVNSRTPNPHTGGAGSSSAASGWSSTGGWGDTTRANPSHGGTSPEQWSAEMDANAWVSVSDNLLIRSGLRFREIRMPPPHLLLRLGSTHLRHLERLQHLFIITVKLPLGCLHLHLEYHRLMIRI